MSLFRAPRRADSMQPTEVLELLPESIVLFDAHGRCTHSNGLALARWGRPELVGRTASDLFAGREEELARGVEEALAAGPAPGLVTRLERPEGEIRVLRVRGGALVLGLPGGGRATNAGPAPETVRRLTHDLIQPLSSISNYAELIRGMSTGEVRNFAERIAAIARKAAENARSAAAPPGEGDAGE